MLMVVGEFEQEREGVSKTEDGSRGGRRTVRTVFVVGRVNLVMRKLMTSPTCAAQPFHIVFQPALLVLIAARL
jgi:hypothetical protein